MAWMPAFCAFYSMPPREFWRLTAAEFRAMQAHMDETGRDIERMRQGR